MHKILDLEVNLSAFAYRLFHEDFSSVVRAKFSLPVNKSDKLNFCNLCVIKGFTNFCQHFQHKRSHQSELLNNVQTEHSEENIVFEESITCKERVWSYFPDGWNIVALCIKNFIILRRQIG